MKGSDGIKGTRLWTVIARSHHALSLVFEQSIADSGLCPTDFAALEALLHKGPLTISQIQDKVLLATGSMTAAVDRLEDRRLIVRKSTTADRRARMLVLTPKGRQVAQAAFKSHASDVDSLMSALSDVEKQQLYEGLKKIGLLAADTLQGRKRKKPEPKQSSAKRNRKEKQS